MEPMHVPTHECHTITEIKGTRRDPERRAIRVGKAVIATLGRTDVDALGLREGQQLTDELRRRIDEAASQDALRRYAIAALGRRALSEGELCDRLRRRGATDDSMTSIVDRLRELGLLDDEAYAESAARMILSSKPAGARLLESKLRARRIPGPTARRVVERVLDGRDELEDACSLAQRQLRGMSPSVPDQTRRRRVYAALARRGFDPEVCLEATRRAAGGD